MLARTLMAIWFVSTVALSQSPPADPTPIFGTTVVQPTGLEGDIYFLWLHDGWMPKAFGKGHIKGTVYTTRLNVPPQDFRQGFPGVANRLEWFAINYHGKFYVSRPGVYRFELTSDDGSELHIDGKKIIDDGGIHPPKTVDGSVCLATGIHAIRVPYVQGPKFSVALVLKVAPPGEGMRIFDTNSFLPPQEDPAKWPAAQAGPCGK